MTSAQTRDADASERFRLIELDDDPPAAKYVPDGDDASARFSMLEMDEGVPAFPEYAVNVARTGSGETETLVFSTLGLGRAATTGEYRDECHRRGRRLATPREFAAFRARYPNACAKAKLSAVDPDDGDGSVWPADQLLLTVFL